MAGLGANPSCTVCRKHNIGVNKHLAWARAHILFQSLRVCEELTMQHLVVSRNSGSHWQASLLNSKRHSSGDNRHTISEFASNCDCFFALFATNCLGDGANGGVCIYGRASDFVPDWPKSLSRLLILVGAVVSSSFGHAV